MRVTEAYPGEEGKQQIITAYLNQNYYGNGATASRPRRAATSASTT